MQHFIFLNSEIFWIPKHIWLNGFQARMPQFTSQRNNLSTVTYVGSGKAGIPIQAVYSVGMLVATLCCLSNRWCWCDLKNNYCLNYFSDVAPGNKIKQGEWLGWTCAVSYKNWSGLLMTSAKWGLRESNLSTTDFLEGCGHIWEDGIQSFWWSKHSLFWMSPRSSWESLKWTC